METTGITPINNRLLFCMLVSFLCFFIITVYINHDHHDISRLALEGVRTMKMMMPEVLASDRPNPSPSILGSTAETTTTTLSSDPSDVPPRVPSPSAIGSIETTTTATITKCITSEMGEDISISNPKCDFFKGRWIYDPNANPLYKASQCPFLSNQVSCQRNGRPDIDYEKWRWEANDCEIPRFNGTDMLKRLRGKRVIMVGDSLNRNQWESLSCLLYSAIPSKRAYVDVSNGHYKIFRAKDYKFSVEFYWSPFLVQLAESQANAGRPLQLDTLAVSARNWRGANIMVFNTGHWWVQRGNMKAWDFFQYEGNFTENLKMETAFEMAMKTWAHWIDRNVDPAKTKVFFRSISPEHKGQQWCYNQTQPIKDESYSSSFPRTIIETVERIMREMKTPVRYLNITKLSQYRMDAHPTVYTAKKQKLLTDEQRKQPELYADCSHWCLPGLPDTWNSLLYASIIFDASPPSLRSSQLHC